MLRSWVVPLLGAVLAVCLGQAVFAQEGSSVAQPAPAATVVPSETSAVRANAGATQHDAEVSKLPAGGVAAVECAIPGGTIVDVDKVPLMKSWDAKVVDPQGHVHRVQVDSKGQAHNVRIDHGEDRRVSSLTDCQKSAVMQRFPDAVIYDSEYAVVKGKRADKMDVLSQGQRYEVKVGRSNGEIYKVENESQEGGYKGSSGTKTSSHTTTTNNNY